MQNIITKEEFVLQKDTFFEDIEAGAVFIYPTDTIYGLGGNATSQNVVKEIRNIKKRDKQPFSVIVPSKEWIRKNCFVGEKEEKWLEKLPGPYTLILRLKNKECVAENLAPGLDSLGVRIPNHWFSNNVRELGFPIITTSANITGKDFMTSLENLDTELKDFVEFIIYEGAKQGTPSEIIDLTEEVEIIKR